MKQTAVEWLYNKMLYIDNEYDMKLITKGEYQAKRRDIIDQAKEMEKEQKIDFARHCLNKAKDLDILSSFMNVEQYYNETFKNK